MLTDIFLHLVTKYSKDQALANNLWLEIFTKYSEPKRHYHTTIHLENLITDLKEVQGQITDRDSMLFAVYYHDIIYKASSNSNEEDSAKIAEERLGEIGYPADKIAKCTKMILATKLHKHSEDADTNLLTDADLSILGKSPDEYLKYAEKVRKEYVIYPDFVYKPGRKKVLNHFLEMEKIYKTDYFFNRYETQARINLQSELEEL